MRVEVRMEIAKHTSIELVHQADGTRYRVIMAQDREGGWLACFPDLGFFARVYEHDIPPGLELVRIYKSWGKLPTGVDRTNCERAAFQALSAIDYRARL
jgi:hypothetical protein